MRTLLLLPLLALVACEVPSAEAPGEEWLFVGTYTKKEAHVDGKAEGIYRFDLSEEGLSGRSSTTGIINPSYLALDNERNLLYAVSETGPDVDSSGQIVAYQIDEDGGLQELNRRPSYGFAPCYISLHPDGSSVFAANYVGGMVAVYPRLADGSLATASQKLKLEGNGPHPQQEASHPHCIISSPGGRYVYVADKGTDRVSGFKWDTTEKKMSPLDPPFTKVQPGAGPRHLTFHPDLPYLYLINELNNTVDVFAYSPENGSLRALQSISTLPADYEGPNSCADIHISPDGTSLYASNRGHNSLALYQIQEDGRLSPNGFVSTAGDFPRNFLISRDGKQLFVANQNSDQIVVFDRSSEDGGLSQAASFPCPTPVCLKTYTP